MISALGMVILPHNPSAGNGHVPCWSFILNVGSPTLCCVGVQPHQYYYTMANHTVNNNNNNRIVSVLASIGHDVVFVARAMGGSRPW